LPSYSWLHSISSVVSLMTMEEARKKADELNALADANGMLLNVESAITYEASYFNDGSWYVRAKQGFRGRTWIAAK
jgi:hypothetical protein